MLAADEITAALRLIRAIAAGETPAFEEMADAATVFNQMLESWTIDQLAIYQIVNYSHALTNNKQTYTMGTGGDFSTTRPVKIQTPGIIVGGIRHPLEMITPAMWAAIPDKSLSGILPTECWNDNAFPLLNLNFSPIPTAAATFDAYLWQPFTSIVAAVGVVNTSGTGVSWVSGSYFDATMAGQSFVLAGVTYTVSSVTSATALVLTSSAGTQTGIAYVCSSTFSLPPGYGRALRYNLAVELASEFGAALDPTVSAIAQSSKADLRQLNVSNDLAKLPSDIPPAPDQVQ
jgi:hypothetical protein